MAHRSMPCPADEGNGKEEDRANDGKSLGVAGNSSAEWSVRRGVRGIRYCAIVTTWKVRWLSSFPALLSRRSTVVIIRTGMRFAHGLYSRYERWCYCPVVYRVMRVERIVKNREIIKLTFFRCRLFLQGTQKRNTEDQNEGAVGDRLTGVASDKRQK